MYQDYVLKIVEKIWNKINIKDYDHLSVLLFGGSPPLVIEHRTVFTK